MKWGYRVMYEEDVVETKERYTKWLSVSNMNELDLKKMANVTDFEVIEKSQGDYNITSIGYYQEFNYRQIGENFVYKITDKESFVDLCLILFYIAQRLDETNEQSMDTNKSQRYFYEKVKNYVKKHKNYL